MTRTAERATRWAWVNLILGAVFVVAAINQAADYSFPLPRHAACSCLVQFVAGTVNVGIGIYALLIWPRRRDMPK